MTTAPVVTQIDLPLSDRCNLNCSFCYTHGGFGNSFSQEHIDKVFNWIFDQFDAGATEEQRQRGVQISIYGGEPLMEWEHLKDTIVSKRAAGALRNIRVNFGIVTNMTLLTEEKLDWLIANRVGIHPSIDGCATAQDMERKYHDGTGTSAIVYENARRLLSKVSGRSCRMTVAPSTVQYLFESVVFLTKDLGFQTVNAVMAGGVNWTDELIEVHKQQIELLTDWWIQEMREGRHWSLYHLRNMFLGIWSGRRMRNLCSSGVTHLGIDTKGDFYPCHRFCNLDSQPEYLMGNLDTGFTNLALCETFKNYDTATANKERCKDCPAVLGCHAFCLHEMMMAGNGMFEPLDHYCKVWPFYWKMAMRAHSILTAENNQLYFQNYDPRMTQRGTNQQRSAPKPVQGQSKSPCSGDCGKSKKDIPISIGQKEGSEVDRILIPAIYASRSKDGVVDFNIQHQFLDKEGKVLGTNTKRCSSANLISVLFQKGMDITPFIASVTELLTVPNHTGNSNLVILLTKQPIEIRVIWMDNLDKQNQKVYTGVEIEASKLRINDLKGMIPLLAPLLT